MKKVHQNYEIPNEVRNFEPKGTFAQEKFEIDISVCFFEETGRSASEKIKEKLKANGKRNVGLISCVNDSNFNKDEIETAVAKSQCMILLITNHSLMFESTVFAVRSANYYCIPIIVVHDISSCYFPNPSSQPKYIQSSGIFQEKAITYVDQYSDAVIGLILERAKKVCDNYKICVCSSGGPSVPKVSQSQDSSGWSFLCCGSPVVPDIEIQVENIENNELPKSIKDFFECYTCSLKIHGKLLERYTNSVLNRSNSVVVVIDTVMLDNMESLLKVIKYAQKNDKRVHFVVDESSLSDLKKYLKNKIKNPVSESKDLLITTESMLTVYLQENEINLTKITPISWKGSGNNYNPKDNIISPASSWSTYLFNCGINNGKWYYEVELIIANEMYTIGWATKATPLYGTGNGIGDDKTSYAYEGMNAKTWNSTAQNYGEVWSEGDIVGVFIDLDNQEISFSLNGVNLGVAYSKFVKKDQDGNPYVYFPALSLSEKQKCEVNFGNKPFKFPNTFPARPMIEEIDITLLSCSNKNLSPLSKIIEIERTFDNYEKIIPRTRAFLSHKRSSAQGTAGRIWQQLKSDYNMFLDSEASFDLHNLKYIVKYTGTFIFILSDGIFNSHWCLEELRSAIANERPIIVLKDYQFEWPDDLSPNLKDIVKVVNNSPQYLYIAEHFNLCLQKIKNHLEMTDEEIIKIIEEFPPDVVDQFKNDSFNESSAIILEDEISLGFEKLFKILYNSYPCPSISAIRGVTVKLGNMSDNDIIALVKNCNRVKFFNFWDGQSITDKSIIEMGQNCIFLEELVISETQMTDAGLKVIGKHCKFITNLALYNNEKITIEGVEAIINGTKTCLRNLDVTNVEPKDEFFKILGDKHPEILRISLTPSTNVTDKAIDYLIERCNFILVLQLNSVKITEKVLEKIFQTWHNLQDLQLPNVEVSKEVLDKAPANINISVNVVE